jgi:hypothetical protein
VYKALSAVEGGRFTIAAAFGNVHGVYSPGNVQLTPQILHNCQAYIKEKEGLDTDKPCSFVFHGGSGSSREDIRYAIEAGTIKMNIDTDTQWCARRAAPSLGAGLPLRPPLFPRVRLATLTAGCAAQPLQGLLGWHPLVRERVPPVPAGPDRQPRRRREAQQEVLRPAHGPAPRRGVHGQAPGGGRRGPQLHQRALSVLTPPTPHNPVSTILPPSL